jgi:hypothetical protein
MCFQEAFGEVVLKRSSGPAGSLGGYNGNKALYPTYPKLGTRYDIILKLLYKLLMRSSEGKVSLFLGFLLK